MVKPKWFGIKISEMYRFLAFDLSKKLKWVAWYYATRLILQTQQNYRDRYFKSPCDLNLYFQKWMTLINIAVYKLYGDLEGFQRVLGTLKSDPPEEQ